MVSVASLLAVLRYAVQQHGNLVEETNYNVKALAAQPDGAAKVENFKKTQWYRLRDIQAECKKGFSHWAAEAHEVCGDAQQLQAAQAKARKKKRGGKDLAPPLEMPKGKIAKPMNESKLTAEGKEGGGAEGKTADSTAVRCGW